MAGIDFYDASNFTECLQFYYKGYHKPGFLFSISPTTLLYQDLSCEEFLFRLDCSKGKPECKELIKLTKSRNIKDMCYTNDMLICLYEDCPGIYAQTLLGKPLWSVESVATGRQMYNMTCISVTTDDKGHVFVCDSNHNCVRVFSTGGEYLGCLVKEGEHKIGSPQMIRWCKKHLPFFYKTK